MLQRTSAQQSELKIEQQAEACYRQAIKVARHQSDRSIELRATTSLARLLTKQGRRNEARTMLAEIYNWFTEGCGFFLVVDDDDPVSLRIPLYSER